MKPARGSLSFGLALSVLAAWAFATTTPQTAAHENHAQQDAAARELLANGQVALAIRALTQQTRSEPQDAEAFHLLSLAYYELEQWDRSIHAAESAVALNPQRSEYHLWLGRAYGNKAEHSNWFLALMLARKTRAEFEKAVALDGENFDARSDLAEYYLEAPAFLGGGDNKAREEARALDMHDAASSHYVQARVAEKSGDAKLAEQEYREAIKVSSEPGGEWLNLAAFYRHQKQYPEMEEAIKHATAYEKKGHSLLFDAADLLYRAGRNFSGAAQLLRAYLSSHQPATDLQSPSSFQAHYLLGEIMEKQGDKPSAIAEYQAALQLAGDYRPARQALERVSRR